LGSNSKKVNFIIEIHIKSKDVQVIKIYYKIICGFNIFFYRKIKYASMRESPIPVAEKTLKYPPPPQIIGWKSIFSSPKIHYKIIYVFNIFFFRKIKHASMKESPTPLAEKTLKYPPKK
jgi:hypothetical protein